MSGLRPSNHRSGSYLRRLWLAALSLCALFSIAAGAGWSADVKQVSNINPISGAYPYLPTVIGDDLYFFADTNYDDQLFRTRGDVTVQLTNIYSDSTGVDGSYHPNLPPVQVGSSLLFIVMELTSSVGDRPYEIWRVNEALPEGAELYWRSTGLFPLGWAQAGDLLYIRMRNGDSDELWMTDGGNGGLQLVKAGLASKWGRAFEQTGATTAYFESFTNSPVPAFYWRVDAGGVAPLDTLGVSSTVAVVQDDLYVTNGTRVVRVPAGSTQGELVFDGGWDARIQVMHAAGGKLFFVDAEDPFTGPSFVLWRYDPAQKQLQRIGAYSSRINGFVAMGNSVYFVVAGADDTLMRLPNDSATAVAAATLDSASLVDGNSPSMAAGSSLLYMQVVKDNGWELWGSDGTAAGTRSLARLFDYEQDNNFNNCPCITVAGDTLYFDRMASAKSVEMWRVNVAVEENHPLYLPHVVKP